MYLLLLFFLLELSRGGFETSLLLFDIYVFYRE